MAPQERRRVWCLDSTTARVVRAALRANTSTSCSNAGGAGAGTLNSERFALFAAAALVERGFKVFLFGSMCCTPMVVRRCPHSPPCPVLGGGGPGALPT